MNLTDVAETVNQAPTITAATYSLAENSANGTVLGKIEATDADGDVLTYSIISGNSGQAFGLDSSTGQLTVASSTALDYETTPTFSLEVEVSDGTLTASATFTVNLTDVDETVNQPPTIVASTFSLAENSPGGTLVGTVSASDANNDTLTYTIKSGNTLEAFSLDSKSGELKVINSVALDFETTPTFSLEVEVSDGTLSASATLTVNLTDVDEEEITLSLSEAAEMIYPNPSNGIINIKMIGFQEATIYHLSGKKELYSQESKIDISGLSEGIYLIILKNQSGELFTTKIIKE